MNRNTVNGLCSLVLLSLAPALLASSHREAPFVTEHPKVDGTDFYMFRSYEPGRERYVTLIANYLPLQDAYGGPNYFTLDSAAQYGIHVDNDGDSREDLTLWFRFYNYSENLSLAVGPEGSTVDVPIPLAFAGPVLVQPGGLATINNPQLYTVQVQRGPYGAPLESAVNASNGGTFFAKPVDHAGMKTFPDYDAYAALYMDAIAVPGCSGAGRVFAGQRKDPFAVNLGEIFDLVNLDPLGAPDAKPSAIESKNVTSLVVELPIDCLTGGSGDVIGAWTTARLPRERSLVDSPSFEHVAEVGAETVQVSRLGMPLVNEVVIGLPDKNRFNASHPSDDLQFATYVTNPTLPELLELLFGVRAPNNFPRADLLAAFVTGISGLNAHGFGEMLRLNTSIPPTPAAAQSSLGVAGGDNAGFPNGRRPGDDVVDIELRVAMGLLCHAFPGAFGCGPADAPDGALPYTDGTAQIAAQFDAAFPYLRSPVPGSPNGVNGVD